MLYFVGLISIILLSILLLNYFLKEGSKNMFKSLLVRFMAIVLTIISVIILIRLIRTFL